MRRFGLAIIFCLLAAAPAWATKISIQSQQVNNWNARNTSATNPPHLRVYSDTAFYTNDSPPQYVPQGSPGSGGPAYLDIACTQSGSTVTIPAFTLDSTKDAKAGSKNAHYNFYWFTTSGSLIGPMVQMQNIQAPGSIVSASGCSPVGTCAYLSDLVLYNQGSPALPPDQYPTQAQVTSQILANLSTGAPNTSTYVIQVPDSHLPNAQALNGFSSGTIPKIGASGVLAAAVAGTDYAPGSGTAPITVNGSTISCPTCLTGSGLTLNQLLIGGGGTSLSALGASGTSTQVLHGNASGAPSFAPVGIGDVSGATGTGNFVLGTGPTISGGTFSNPSLTGTPTAVSLGGLTAPVTPNAAGGTTLGSAALPFSSIYVGSAATNNVQVTAAGSITGARVFTLPDANSNPVAPSSAPSNQFATGISAAGVISYAQPSAANLSNGVTGSGAIVLANSPALVTPTLGAASATSIAGLTGQLTPNAAGGIPAGTAALPFSSVYIGAAATNNIQVTGTATAARTFTLPDANSNPVQPSTAGANQFATGISSAGVISYAQPVLSGIGNPTANVSFAYGTDTLSATFGNITGGPSESKTFGALTGSPSVSQFSISDTSGNTNTGCLFCVNSVSGSTVVNPLQVLAQGVNGIKVDPAGIVRAVAAGGLDASGLVTGTLGNSRLPASIQLAGLSLNTQATGTVGAAELDATVNPTTNQTAEYPIFYVHPTLNASGSSAGRTIDLMALDTVNTGLVGLTVNLAKWSYGGTQKALIDSSGNLTLAGALNNVTVTQPGSASTFTLAGGKTLTVNASLTLAGTDGTTMTFPGSSDTVAGIAATQTLTNKTLGSGTAVSSSISFSAGVKQTFAPNGTTAGLNAGSVSSDPSSPANGDLWYNSTGNQLSAYINGAVVHLGASGGGSTSPGGSPGQIQFNNAGSFGGMSEWAYVSPAVTVTKNSLNTTLTDLQVFVNSTASLSNQKQYSGAEHFSGTTWDNSLSSAASVTVDHRVFEGGSGANDTGFGSVSITAATNATPIQVTTSSAHGYTTGQQVVVTGVGGNTNANGTWYIQNVNSTNFILIGSAGNAAYTSGGKVARAGLGWMGIASQYNGGGYNIQDGVDTNGHFFLNSATPTSYSSAPLQVTGAIYQTSAAQGIPYNQLGQGGSPQTYEYSDFFLNVTSTPSFSGISSGEYAMSVNLALNSSGASDFGVAGYFATQGNKANQSIWGINPLVQSSVLVTALGGEFDVNNNAAGNPPDYGSTGYQVGAGVVCGGSSNCTSALATWRGGASVAWKHGAHFQSVGYTGYSGEDPSLVWGSSNTNNLVYGLNLRTAVFQANPTNKISSVIAGPFGVPSVVAVNSAGTADVPLLTYETYNFTLGDIEPAQVFGGPTAGPSVFYGGASGGTTVYVVGKDGQFNGMRFDNYSVGNQWGYIEFRRAMGTLASPAQVVSGQGLGEITFRAYDSSGYNFTDDVQFRAFAAENQTASAHGGYLSIMTTPRGTVANAEYLRLMPEGELVHRSIGAPGTLIGSGDLSSQADFAVYAKGSKIVIAYNSGGTMHYITAPITGTAGTVTWTDSTTAP